jgi:hypothetical protein
VQLVLRGHKGRQDRKDCRALWHLQALLAQPVFKGQLGQQAQLDHRVFLVQLQRRVVLEQLD